MAMCLRDGVQEAVSERFQSGFRAVSGLFGPVTGLSPIFLQKREIEREREKKKRERERTNKVEAPKNSKKRKTRNKRKERMGRRETEGEKGFGKKRLNLPRTQRVVTRSW